MSETLTPAELAALLAAKICHDLLSPASAMSSALDLLDDPDQADMREDALSLVGNSGRKITAQLAFMRVAFGASAAAHTFSSEELRKLTKSVFADMRAELDWAAVPAALNKAAARTVLNLAQLGGGALPRGGAVTVTAVEEGAWLALSVVAQGSRARLRAEAVRGLRGEPLGEGVAGAWVQGFYVRLILDAAGGHVAVDEDEGRVALTARIPLDPQLSQRAVTPS